MEKMRKLVKLAAVLGINYVPEELVIEILLRLPVESLLRYKAVCKNWYILITRSDFINNHFNHYHRNNNHTRLLICHHIENPTLITPGFAASLSRIHHDLDYLRIPLTLPTDIVGPVNGLFLLCHDHRHRRPHDYPLALLNPATRALRPLFVPDANQNPNMRSDLQTFGFGFDPSTNDFKVVVFGYIDDCTLGPIISLINISIFSLANDSWKHLEPYQQLKRNTPFFSSGTTYFNGACHWLSFQQDCLLSFDLGSEVMREINGPQDILSIGASNLFVYKNEALAILHDQSDCLIDLMVMKEEGRWTKYFTMDLSDFPQYLQVNQLFGICKNNRLFVAAHVIQKNEKGAKLVLYDPVTHEIEEVRVPCLFKYDDSSFSYNNGVFSYNESLVSIKGGGNKSSSIRSSPKFLQ